MRTHVIIPDALVEEVDRLVTARKRSLFIANAVEKELKKMRLLSIATRAAGSLKDVVIPGWETSKSAAKWIHDVRRESARE
jgi:metal-responsive CopG/Arc/MetJ family transcriptional regulator